jgi:hypothetical protein
MLAWAVLVLHASLGCMKAVSLTWQAAAAAAAAAAPPPTITTIRAAWHWEAHAPQHPGDGNSSGGRERMYSSRLNGVVRVGGAVVRVAMIVLVGMITGASRSPASRVCGARYCSQGVQPANAVYQYICMMYADACSAVSLSSVGWGSLLVASSSEARGRQRNRCCSPGSRH